MDKKSLEFLFEERSNERHVVPIDHIVKCYECDWTGILADCGIEYEQETWEMPVYQINTCPECGEGIEI